MLAKGSGKSVSADHRDIAQKGQELAGYSANRINSGEKIGTQQMLTVKDTIYCCCSTLELHDRLQGNRFV
jgi:hypothetical protein